MFAGVDGRADARLPDRYAEWRDVDDSVSFAEAETGKAEMHRQIDQGSIEDRLERIVEVARSVIDAVDGS